MSYFQYSNNKSSLKQHIEKDKRFETVSNDVVHVINTLTGTTFRPKKGEQTTNMCKAIDDMLNDAKQDGFTSGWETGLEALVNSLSPFMQTFDHLMDAIHKNVSYAAVTSEQVKKYYNQ